MRNSWHDTGHTAGQNLARRQSVPHTTYKDASVNTLPGETRNTFCSGDLATQLAYRVTTGDMVIEAHMKLGGILGKKAAFHSEVPMKESTDDHTDWLKENVEEGHWSHFARALTVEDGCLTEETVFLFKTDSEAMLFKLRFG
jgi:hypothetical protein